MNTNRIQEINFQLVTLRYSKFCYKIIKPQLYPIKKTNKIQVLDQLHLTNFLFK